MTMLTKKQLKSFVNCWFCNENTITNKKSDDGWVCNKCQQYNGFTPDGDYNTDIPGQHDLMPGTTDTVCEAGVFHTAPPVLCNVCHNNQALYVRQLASFKSMNEGTYDEELKSYKVYLEEVYKLCPACECKVKKLISEQDKSLQSKLSSSQQELLQAANMKQDRTLNDSKATSLRQLQFPSIPAILFQCCFFFTAAHVIICLRLFAVTVISETRTTVEQNFWFSRWMQWVIAVVPAYFALSIQESVVHFGTLACLAGLFSCGKYSLYPEDCVHLLLRLFTLVACMEWIHVTEAQALLISIFTAVFALGACCRPRKSRYFSQLFLSRKDIKSLGPVNKAVNIPAPDPAESSLNETRETDTSDSSLSEYSLPPYEGVCQDLETFSIGLGKKSGSKSSIWSLPATIQSSLDPNRSSSGIGLNATSEQHMSPDSTTGDRIPLTRPGTPRSVLSPSRLCYINFNSTSGSRSPSPWAPIMETNEARFEENSQAECGLPPLSQPLGSSGDMLSNNQATPKNNQQCEQVSTDKFPPRGGQFPTREVQAVQTPSEHQHLHSSKASHPSHFGPNNFLSAPHHDQLPKNSSTLFSSSQQLSIDNNGHYHNDNPHENGLRNCTNSSQGVRRRSQRLAMAGKLPKPWPLRKSYSCNNAMDISFKEKAGACARLESLQPTHQLSPSTRDMGFAQRALAPQSMPPKEQPQPATMLQSTRTKTNEFLQYRDSSSALVGQSSHAPGVRNEEFLRYRDGSHYANPTQSVQPSGDFVFDTNAGQRNWFSNKLVSHVDSKSAQNEFSDAEDMDIDEPWDHSERKLQQAAKSGTKDMSLRWVLLGTVIGASVTCNIFFLLHGWIQR